MTENNDVQAAVESNNDGVGGAEAVAEPTAAVENDVVGETPVGDNDAVTDLAEGGVEATAVDLSRHSPERATADPYAAQCARDEARFLEAAEKTATEQTDVETADHEELSKQAEPIGDDANEQALASPEALLQFAELKGVMAQQTLDEANRALKELENQQDSAQFVDAYREKFPELRQYEPEITLYAHQFIQGEKAAGRIPEDHQAVVHGINQLKTRLGKVRDEALQKAAEQEVNVMARQFNTGGGAPEEGAVDVWGMSDEDFKAHWDAQVRRSYRV